jgi:hypothetical protein
LKKEKARRGCGGLDYGFMLRYFRADSTNGPATRRMAMMVMGALRMQQHANFEYSKAAPELTLPSPRR